jgi:putative transposase
MDLISNQTFKLLSGKSQELYPAGFYRVIFDDPITGKTVCVCIERMSPTEPASTGRPKMERTKRPRKKPVARLFGELLWMERIDLKKCSDEGLLLPIEVQREAIYYQPLESHKDQKLFEQRRNVMTSFLDIEKLKESVLVHKGLGGLVREAMAATGVCRSFVYRQWSTLCRLGISEQSLRPRRDRCGAPKIARPCAPGGRKKAGRKTQLQRVARKHGVDLAPKQPGMTVEWRSAIIAADKQINSPVKPSMRQRRKLILESHFVKKYQDVNGKLIPIDPKIGEYPNAQQIRRVLEIDIPRLTRLQQATTTGHFKRSLRGLTGRNWQGVAGPGHTWAIDSTVGDIYLRSSLNRAWIIGRPIVYVVVDVWSTAVVGFYVCLTGPSWNTAKISIFNSAVNPALLGEIWGYQPVICLNPAPTLCFQLMCDRGEYLSKAASQTAFKVKLNMAYAAPYRPDLKGLVEVLHRIAKDAQFLFMPGAMNFRRAEYDLRKSHPEESAFTVMEYVQYLHQIFCEYNLTADRSHRLDAHMAAAGVFPSPAGLWRWGYEMGIGFRKSISQADLITSLLPQDTARVGRSSVVFAGNDYQSDVITQEGWTTAARNFGSLQIPIHHYPGPVGRIWTPHTHDNGLLELQISDQAKASKEVTFDELSDSIANTQLQRADIEHTNTINALKSLRRVDELRKNAVQLTAEADARANGPQPSMTEARTLEVSSEPSECGSESKTVEKLKDDAMEAYEEMMRNILRAGDTEGDDHA